MNNITPNDIQNIRDFNSLLDFFRDKLDWRIPDGVEFEDVAFTWSAEDLDLDENTEDRIVESWQLPPFPSAELTFGFVEETQPWGIFFLQFNSDSIYRTALRRVLRGLVNRRDHDPNLPAWEHDNLLFICTTTDFQRFAFAHFADNENWRRSVLSIFSWEQGDTHIRTLCEYNLPALALPYDGFPNDAEWLTAWKAAFDVEAVTDKFFADYQRVFAKVETAVDGTPENDTEAKRLYTQRLFNRLMFLRFIEKKGWLTYNGNRDYLRALFEATENQPNENFLNDRLFYAFFHGLGSELDLDEELDELVEARGDVPFLNGGLFERKDYEFDRQHAIHIPNEEFAEILNLFERYNFTVTESTPLDVEVAVDPEMLGKVFEELVTGRHDTGSYYTPRPVVSFMCRESLKICLKNKADETEECLKKFVDDGDATEIRNPENVLHVLQTLRICDPACGSGAYLLGMMSELLRLREALFQSNQIDSPTIYQRKLDIIQNNLYGVDKDEFAVNIAMLRLWLSLAVDYEGDTPQPLPNLDYKVAIGDSLTGPTPLGANLGFALQFIEQIQEHQAEYLVTHNENDKQRLRETIAELRENIQDFQANDDEFMWEAEFPEVFLEGGFDIVIGNPPYVRQELIRSIRPTLQRIFPDVYTGTADLYIYFYRRGCELLQARGVLTYISSNSFLRARYGERLRTYFAEQMQMQVLLDFGSVPVFRASVNTCIVLVENTLPNEDTLLAANIRDEVDIPRLSEVFQERAFTMNTSDLPPDGWVLAPQETISLIYQVQNTGTQMNDVIQGQFYFGIKTGCNDAFIIDSDTREQLIAADPNSQDLIKSLLRGRNLRRWIAETSNEYLIVIASSVNREWQWTNARNGTEAERIFAETYPAIHNHLSNYRDRLIARDDQGMYFWELRSCTYYAEFERPKIIYPDISPTMRACYDTTDAYCLQTTYILPTEDLSLFAILNSELVCWYSKHRFQRLGSGVRFIAQYMRRVPIADRTTEQQAELSALVEQILADPHSDRVPEIEREIDEFVYHLYGLSDQEIELIKQTYRDAGMDVS